MELKVNNAKIQQVPTINAVTTNTTNSVKDKKAGMNTTTKVLLGSGLTALAAVGIYLATKGKKGLPKNISSLAEFKKHGQLIKGEAVLNNGEKFTGTLNHTTKSGKNIALKYENGKLVQSNTSNTTYDFYSGKPWKTRSGCESISSVVNIQKDFKYSKNGELQNVKTLIQDTNSPGRQILELNKVEFNGRKVYELKGGANTGNGEIRKEIFLNKDGKGIDFVHEGPKYTKYTKDGKVELRYNATKGYQLEIGDSHQPHMVYMGDGKLKELQLWDVDVPEVGRVDIFLRSDSGARYYNPITEEKVQVSQEAIQKIKAKCQEILSKVGEMTQTVRKKNGYEMPKNPKEDISYMQDWTQRILTEDLLSNLRFNPR